MYKRTNSGFGANKSRGTSYQGSKPRSGYQGHNPRPAGSFSSASRSPRPAGTGYQGHNPRPRPTDGYGGVRRPATGGFNRFSSGGPRRSSPARRGRSFGEHMDISLFIKKANPNIEVKKHENKHRFIDFKLGKEIQANLARKKYETPTPIQDIAIPVVIEGKDVIGLANTGTGKTGAFLLPLIQKCFNDHT